MRRSGICHFSDMRLYLIVILGARATHGPKEFALFFLRTTL
jgi:hypothetical protein